MLRPKRFRQSRLVLLLQILRRPAIETRQTHTLRLRRTVRSRPWLGQVLLMVRLGKVPKPSVLLVIPRPGNLRLNLPVPERLLVRHLARLDQPLLVIVEVIRPRSVLTTAIIPLAHVLRGIVILPEHAQNIHVRNFRGIVHHPKSLRVSRLTRACLLVRRVGSVSRAISDGSGVNALGQSPNTLFASPKASVGEDGLLVSIGNFLDVVVEDVMLETGNSRHFVGTARKGLVGRDHARSVAAT
mmetsp:Transcript_16395/g.25700  ORF Transcript_16395/g.25700 Transcript_16395/m.25700 type:complete len:242 (-) Transcript_16395:28-753(-)